MKYKEILKQIAVKENVSVREIENEMKTAIEFVGLECSAEALIKTIAVSLKQKTIYSIKV